MFIGRDKELEYLSAWYGAGSNNIMALHGKSGCGKTALLKEFARAVPHVYYAAGECTPQMQLELLGRRLQPCGGEAPGDWQAAFAMAAPQELIILDDFQYMAKMPQVLDAVQEYGTHRKIIICADAKPDLDAAELRLSPMSFYEAVGFFPRYAPFDRMALYAAFGGLPKHLSYIDTALTMEQNIMLLLLSPHSPLFNEAQAVMRRDLREAAIYNTIMAQVAAGCTKIAQLHEATGIGKTKLSVYLKNLVSFGLLHREVSLSPPGPLATNAAWGQYRISDHLLRFWFTFVLPNLSELNWGNVAEVYRSSVAPRLDSYIAQAFTEICSDYLLAQSAAGKTPFTILEIGRWWRGGQALDILATGGSEFLMAVCKYTTEQMQISDYAKVFSHFSAVSPGGEGARYIFCNAGFSSDVRSAAARDGVTLVAFYGEVT